MKKIIFIIIIVSIVAVVGAHFFKPSSSAPAAQRMQVVASGYVPYTLANQIAGGQAQVSMLLPPNAEPHAFEPTPGDMVTVHKAAVFVYVSDELEPWAKDVLGAAGKGTRVVQLAEGLPQSDDPHVWMDCANVLLMARKLAGALAQADPQHAPVYQENLDHFEEELSALNNDFPHALADCKSREVVHVGHLAFSALAKRYNLKLSALAGTSHDGEHAARKLADLVKYIRARNVQVVFTEEAVSPRLAQTVAVETGASLLPLYTIEHVSKDDFNKNVSYAELMRRNLENLKQGLSCQAL